MAATANSLGKIHQLHLQLEDARNQLERGPKQVDIRRRLVETRQREFDEVRESHKRLKMKADELSLQLKTNEARIEELKVKLNACASNKEFNLIKGQIEADTVSNSVLEDEILEAFEKVDESEVAVAEAKKAVAEAETQSQLATKKVSDAEPGLRSEAERLTVTIREAESSIPPKVSEKYRRLVEAHGAGALADVSDNVCSSCYVGVTPQMMVQLNTGTPIFCKTCGRMLYLKDD